MNEYKERFTDDHYTTMTDESVVDLLRDLREESINLVRQQVELAKQETVEKVSTLGKNSVSMIAGGLVAYTGFIFLMLGLTFLGAWGLLQAGISQTASICIMSLIVGAIVAGVGYFLIRKAISTFKHTSVVPEKTVNSLKEDRTWLTHKRP